MKSLTTDVSPEEMRALSQRRRNGEFGSSWLGSPGSVLPFAMVAGFALLFLDGAMSWVVLAGAVLVGRVWWGGHGGGTAPALPGGPNWRGSPTRTT